MAITADIEQQEVSLDIYQWRDRFLQVNREKDIWLKAFQDTRDKAAVLQSRLDRLLEGVKKVIEDGSFEDIRAYHKLNNLIHKARGEEE